MSDFGYFWGHLYSNTTQNYIVCVVLLNKMAILARLFYHLDIITFTTILTMAFV